MKGTEATKPWHTTCGWSLPHRYRHTCSCVCVLMAGHQGRHACTTELTSADVEEITRQMTAFPRQSEGGCSDCGGLVEVPGHDTKCWDCFHRGPA